MWTPRRILLLIFGLAGFTAAYLGYARVLGGVDGLPDLPTDYLIEETLDPGVLPPDEIVQPTLVKLQEAFGQHSPEVTDYISYKTKLELGEKGLVFACGQPVFSAEPSRFVTVSPFSLAKFGKPKPPSARQPGEVQEISTFHADKAVLEFDRPLSSPQDALGGKAKLVGIELVSTPDVPSHDSRKGRVTITNNQRSADPGQFFVVRTPGPLFYRMSEQQPGAKAAAPQIWTAAAVEITDRRNLPRPLRATAPAAVPFRSDDLRGRNAVANILLGLTYPPPTITAEGMKIYLDPQDEKAPADKKNGTGYAGVRLIELCEKVQLNLWSDGGNGGFPGSDPGRPVKPTEDDPPAAAAAVLGGLTDAAAVARRLEQKTLMVIETLGRVRYDFPAGTARFESAQAANPAVPNHVTVSRLSARGAQDNLFCKVLTVQFADPPAAAKTANAGRPQPNGPAGGMKVKSLTATGEHVFVSVEAEQLLAQGTELRYEVDPSGTTSTTIMRGAPVIAARERNHLQGGSAGKPAEIRIVATDPPAGSKEKKRNAVTVLGPGVIKMFDPAANDTTLQASWGTSLTQERQIVGGREQDLLKFEGGGTFADTKGGMHLSADRLWLWLGAADGDTPAAGGAGKALSPTALKPQRLVGTGRVFGKSPELKILDTDQLTVWFRDVAPPVVADPVRVAAKAPVVAPAIGNGQALPVIQPVSADTPAGDAPSKEPARKDGEKPKEPMCLSARVIESWVVRYPLPDADKSSAPKPVGPPGQGNLKYELERARCEDRVRVHQPPNDPAKSPRGVDIFGTRLNLDQSQAGGVLTVYGSADEWAKVFFEELSLFGPVVKIDQPQNTVAVDGQGQLIMPGGSGATGDSAPSDRPVDMTVKWTQEMRFNGAMQNAEFLGNVYAVQQPRPGDLPRTVRIDTTSQPRPRGQAVLATRAGGPAPSEPEPTITTSTLACYRLNVTFDRPIYFNQVARQKGNQPDGREAAGKAKMRTAVCNPMPDDELAKANTNDLLVKEVVFFEDVRGPGGKQVRAHRIVAKQIDVKNDDREQTMFAAGPGVVRILQAGSKDAANQGPAPAGAKPDDQEMKLTVVHFPSRMIARDTGKVFQEATFDDGAKVVQVPSEDLNRQVVEYDLPPRGVFLACSDSLKVSTTRIRKDAPAQQKMSAEGNARFMTDEYEGLAAKITYDSDATTLYGDRNGPANLQRRRRLGVNNQDFYSGEKIVYNKDGTIDGDRSIGGTFTPGR